MRGMNPMSKLSFNSIIIAFLPILVKPETRKELFLYLVILESTVSVVLTKEEKGAHKPIYYINKFLLDAELLYPLLEKIALILVIVSKKLHPYFKDHSLIVSECSIYTL